MSAHRLYLDAAYETSLGMVLGARGWTNQEIAEHMGFSVNRVKECLSNAFRKLGVTSRKELGRFMLS